LDHYLTPWILLPKLLTRHWSTHSGFSCIPNVFCVSIEVHVVVTCAVAQLLIVEIFTAHFRRVR